MIEVSTDVYSTISVAIQEMIPVVATYDGHHRLLCPHAQRPRDGSAANQRDELAPSHVRPQAQDKPSD